MATLKKFATASPLRWLLLVPLPVLWIVAAHLGWLDFFENRTVDLRFRYRGELAAPVPLVYVDIDSTALEVVGNWPWSRAFFARTCHALLETGQVEAIGIDLVTSDVAQSQLADRKKLIEGNIEFAKFLRANPPVVLAAAYAAESFHDERGVRSRRLLPLVQGDPRPPEQWEEPEKPRFDVGRKLPWSPATIGLIDTLRGDTRIVPLHAPTNVQPYRHMAVELVRLHYRLPHSGVQISADHLDFVQPDGTLLRRVPLTRGQMLEVNWRTSWASPHNQHFSFATVYAQAESLLSGTADEQCAARAFFAQPIWKNALVLIGPVDRLLQDLGPAPFDTEPVPKVGVHGNLVQSIIAGQFLRHPAEWIGWLITSVLTLLVTALAVTGGTRTLVRKLAAVCAALGYLLLAFELFKRTHVVLPLSAPLGAAFTTSFVALIWQVVLEEKQKGRIKQMFGTYVAPALVNRMVESGEEPRLGGVEETITAYFSDIQSFSAFSEVMAPPQLVELMNEFLTACTDIVQAEGGTLDKYIGDAVVAMYGAPLVLPDHASRACIGALRVQQRVAELRKKWQIEADKWPQIVHHLRTRIGLNSGPAIVGNMGSHTRFNYTMMGDNVNLAARMESGAKHWGVYTLCTEATRLGCEQHAPAFIAFRPLGRIVVKGRTQPVPIHELVDFLPTLKDSVRECLALFARGLAQYHARDWSGAIESFQASARLETFQPGRDAGVSLNPSLVYLDRAAEFRDNEPPADWNGVYVMTEK